MSVPIQSPISFTNVGRDKWWRRGIFASQTGYVTMALLLLVLVMHLASPYFLTAGNLQNVANNFSFIAIAISQLHEQSFGGRTLTVNEARPMQPRGGLGNAALLGNRLENSQSGQFHFVLH